MLGVDLEQRKRRAQETLDQACREQTAGHLAEAIRLYKVSLALHPTAEAHTFLGWAYGLDGRFDDAIAECKKAIAVDPEFGNPYNDIGVYLMQQDRYDEAIPWLEKAKTARRYEPRQFPYMNLGRIYLKQGKWVDALREFESAVRVAPKDEGAAKALHSLRARLN